MTEKEKLTAEIMDGIKSLYAENELLRRKLGIATNALTNIKCWKTFGVQNNPMEMVSHAIAALKEIEASEIQEGE
jgi:hypothetical protein